MKIAILSLTEGDGHGAEMMLEHFLQSWNDSQHELTVIATKNSKICRVSQEKGMITIPLNIKDNFLSTLLGIQNTIKILPQFDLVHGWTARTFEWAWYIAKKKNIKYLCTLHDHPLSSVHKKHRHVLVREIANRASSLICVSRAMEKACIEYGYKGHIEVILNGLIDTGNANKSKSKNIRIGFLGLYAKMKGFSIIKQWIETLCNENNNNTEWFLYGTIQNEIEKEVLQIISKYPKNVILKGYRSPEVIYSEIDILVTPSTQFDSLPTVLIEAAMKGIPSIATNLGGANEIIVQNITGFLFNLNNPESGLTYLRNLIRDPVLLKKMGKSARQHFENNFNINRMIDQYRTLWESYQG
jgi:glycosyltransferase involved in cell wall biosynthesis